MPKRMRLAMKVDTKHSELLAQLRAIIKDEEPQLSLGAKVSEWRTKSFAKKKGNDLPATSHRPHVQLLRFLTARICAWSSSACDPACP